MAETTTPADRPGCLSEAELSRVREAPPGEAPEDLARHLAGCERCQERALFGPGSRPRPRREAPRMPSPARTLTLLVLLAAAILAFFVTLKGLLARF
jgi:hypothetical protein